MKCLDYIFCWSVRQKVAKSSDKFRYTLPTVGIKSSFITLKWHCLVALVLLGGDHPGQPLGHRAICIWSPSRERYTDICLHYLYVTFDKSVCQYTLIIQFKFNVQNRVVKCVTIYSSKFHIPKYVGYNIMKNKYDPQDGNIRPHAMKKCSEKELCTAYLMCLQIIPFWVNLLYLCFVSNMSFLTLTHFS